VSAGVQLSERTISTFVEAAATFRPPPKLTVTQWAERERVLSSETSATTGRYRASIAPFQRAMQDAANMPGVEELVLFTSAQIGKSTCLENIFGFFASEDPCPIIYMWPDEQVAKDWSADTLAPMIRDCPVLSKLFEVGARKSASKTLFKKFPGGALTIVGAKSPSKLRRRRARIVICEEVDGYDASAGPEGDPILLVWKRATTFWNRIKILASTCTVKNASRIEGAYQNTNMQKYWVPCPHCSQVTGAADGFQVLKWKRLQFPKDEEPTVANVVYPCEHCGAALTEFDKKWMLENGEWRAEKPDVTKRVGFWINELWSPFVKWCEMATAFLEAVSHRENPQLLKTFINLALAETWEDEGLKIDGSELMQRREDYPPPALPHGVTVLTCGVDVQPDRLELEVVGWGKGEETWSVDRKIFSGDTSKLDASPGPDGTKLPSPWEDLDHFLETTKYMHAMGVRLGIRKTFVDSGYNTQVVYQFTKQMQDKGYGVFASKGKDGFGRPPIGKPTKQGKGGKVYLYLLGVDGMKETLYARLRIQEVGAGYMHFSKEKNDAEYFTQLTAERLEKKYIRGMPTRQWVLPAGKRNEALDCRIMATAAFYALHSDPRRMLDILRKDLESKAKLAAADRRAKIPEGQLSLLEESSQQSAVSIQSPPPDETAEIAVRLEEAFEPAIGEQEYKVAEAVEKVETPAEAEQSAPQRRIRVRRGGWV
jgi:phage terminase large subunit GpA-like protein